MPGETNKSTDVLPVVSPKLSPRKAPGETLNVNVRLVRDQLTDHQRQFGVEVFRGIDVDYSGMISREELEAVVNLDANRADGGYGELEFGIQKGIQAVVDTMDPAKYKQGFQKYKDQQGMWKSEPLQVSLEDDMTDGALDLMEWLRFVRKAKAEKVETIERLYDFMTEQQAIGIADFAINHWFESMASTITENKTKRRQQFARQEQAVKEKIDVNKSMSLDEKEILVLFDAERAKEMHSEIDQDTNGQATASHMMYHVGMDEWLRFLRTHKRTAFTAAISDDPSSEHDALVKADAAIDNLFEEMEQGLSSDAAKRLRSIIKKRELELNEDAAAIANPLGGLKLKPSPAARAARADHYRAVASVTNTRYTPDKKLVYQPMAHKEFSERSVDFYGSQGNWTHSSKRNIADTIHADADAKAMQNKSAVDRMEYRTAAHRVYNDTTLMLKERVKDSINANKKIEKSLQGTEGYVRSLEEAREACATMFELDAEALEEISFCKQKRASRPVAERIKDQVSLALKRRTEELDIESHEMMLAQIDDTQKALWRAREYLEQHLGSKVVAADIDQEAAEMIPSTDPAELVEKTEESNKIEGNVWIKPNELPKTKKGLFNLFQKYAKAYPLRGTQLQSNATFAAIQENNLQVDFTEFSRLVCDYGFNQMLDQDQIAEIFQKFARAHDGQAGSLSFDEFCLVLKEVKKVHANEKADWGNESEPVSPFRPGRKTALTMEGMILENMGKSAMPKKKSLHDKVYIPIHQPVMWKKEVRDLCDSVKGHQAEADRICRKAKAFVDKRRFDDETGRKRILASLHSKQNATMDLIAKLSKQKDVAVAAHEKDIAEKEEVEGRIAAVEDYLSVAVARLQGRQKRPDSERGRDPAEWALDEEVRELRWELHQLGNTHKKLQASIDQLEKIILELDCDINVKTTAMNLDQECVEKIQARLLEKGANAEMHPGMSAAFKKLHDLFQAMHYALDTDGSNTVDSKEWGRAVTKNFDIVSAAFGGASKAEVGKKFREIDADSDGTLTFIEIQDAAEAFQKGIA